MLIYGKPEIRQRILDFVTQFCATNHYPATYEEIRAGCGLSSRSLAYYYVELLARDELIVRSNGVCRSVWPAGWIAKPRGPAV